MNFRDDAPSPGILTFSPVMLCLVLLELDVEVIIHPVN